MIWAHSMRLLMRDYIGITFVWHNIIVCIISDETSQDVAALKVLSECLGKGEKTLCYIYEECSVSYSSVYTQYLLFCV